MNVVVILENAFRTEISVTFDPGILFSKNASQILHQKHQNRQKEEERNCDNESSGKW